MAGHLDRRALSLHASLAALGFAGSLTVSACFIEPQPPSSFRFHCSSDSDCESDERCASGLCQQPCGAEEDDRCSQDAPLCLNGYCSSLCPLAGEDLCPEPQSCTSLAAPGEDPGDSGVCLIACSDANPCADGQLCFEELGLCVGTCMTFDDCNSGEQCMAGFCVPASSEGGSFP